MAKKKPAGEAAECSKCKTSLNANESGEYLTYRFVRGKAVCTRCRAVAPGESALSNLRLPRIGPFYRGRVKCPACGVRHSMMVAFREGADRHAPITMRCDCGATFTKPLNFKGGPLAAMLPEAARPKE